MRVLITGATRGLGLAAAKAASARGATVLLAGRDPQLVPRVADQLGAEPVHVDLADLPQIQHVAEQLGPVDAVVCNAGLQIVTGQTFTLLGIEETFAVNHLAHLALVDALLARDRPPRRVVFVSSDTHNPAIRTGTPDPSDDSIAALAKPAPDTGSVRDAGMRRYVTTKQLAAAVATGLAHEHPDVHFTAFNPGLMPGTGLARQFPPAFRALWGTVLKGIVVLPFASTPAASGEALATLLCDDPATADSGAYVDFRLRQRNASQRAQDRDYQATVLRDSRALIDCHR